MRPDDHAAEAEERWGATDAYKQAAARAARYTDDDWAAIAEEADAITEAFVAAMAEGAESPLELAERHRAHITRWFYDCTREMHAALGQMYVTDHRFTESIDRAAPGLAEFMAKAFAANAARP